MGMALKDPRAIDEEIVRMIYGFSQLRIPAIIDELNRWHPPIDVLETEEKLILIAEIAGISDGDVSIVQMDDIITIKGRREKLEKEKSPMFHHMEINFGPFERNIRVPQKFVGGKIVASYKNGFLRVEINANTSPKRIIPVE